MILGESRYNQPTQNKFTECLCEGLKNLSTCELYLMLDKQTKRFLIYFTCKEREGGAGTVFQEWVIKVLNGQSMSGGSCCAPYLNVTWLVATTVMTSTFPKAPTKTMTPKTRGTKIVVNRFTSRPKSKQDQCQYCCFHWLDKIAWIKKGNIWCFL